MDIKTPLGILRWLLVVGLLAWGTILGLAQTKAAQPTKPAVQPPATAPALARWTENDHRCCWTTSCSRGTHHLRPAQGRSSAACQGYA
jgi:hypothetical protein